LAGPLYPTPSAALPDAVCIECTIATAAGMPDEPAHQDWSIGWGRSIPPLYASLVGVRATLGCLRDPDTVIEEAMAVRIHEHLDDQVGRRVQP